MKLVSLRLLNFRRFREEEIIFYDDFSLIFGKNGSGKSSVLDAIGYALFGPGSTDFVRVKTELLKSHFLRDREPSKVELTFQYGMKMYRIVRVIDAGIKKFSSEFIVENKDTLVSDGLEILGGTEVTNEIIKIIGVDRNTFLRSVFAQQKDLEVLSGPREERKNLIHSILGLDKIEYLIFDVKRLQKEKKTAFEYLKSKTQSFDLRSLEKNILEAENKMKEYQVVLSPILEEKQQKQTEFEKMKQEFSLLQEKKDQIFTLQNSLQSLQKNIQTIHTNIGEYQKHLQNIANKEDQIKVFVGIPEQEKKLQKKLQEFTLQKEKNIQKQKYLQELQVLTGEQEIISSQLKTFQEKNLENFSQKNSQSIIEIEKNILSQTTHITTLISELDQITKEATELKNEMKTITDLGEDSSCPTCKRPLREHYPKLMELFEKSLTEKRELYKQKNDQKNQLQSSLEELRKNLLEGKNLDKNIQQEKNIFIELQAKYQNIVKNRENITEKISQFGDQTYDEKAHLDFEVEYEKIKKDLQVYLELAGEIKNKPIFEQKLKELHESKNQGELQEKTTQETLQKIDFDEKKYLKMKEDYENFYQILESISSKITSIQNQIKENELSLSALQNKKKLFESDQQEQQKLMHEVDYLEHKKNILSQYISHLLQFLKPNIELLTSQYFSHITDGKYSEVTLDENYNILIDGKTIELYSGGERDLVNLCFRLSLGQNLSQRRGNPINFLILDEVLGSQDKERQQNILIRLKKLEEKFSQIFLISHVDEIKEFATNLIEIKSVNREESRVVYY